MIRAALLLTVCGCAQAQGIGTFTWSNATAPPVTGIRFETRTEPPSPVLPFTGSSSGRGVFGQSGYLGAHRFFHDDVNLVYFGYDVLIEPDAQPDTVRLTFLELGIGPLDFAMSSLGGSKPTEWTKLEPPPLPKPQVVHLGDTVEVPVWIDPGTGQRLVDILRIQQPVQRAVRAAPPLSTSLLRMGVARPSGSERVIPTVSGVARDFRPEDAEMRLLQPRITINGTLVGSMMRAGPGATGTLVWFYLPKRGRYILSLVPRPELGFGKVGEVRGGTIRFQMEGVEFALESYTPVAPGSAPYTLYVLHDGDWEPTARNQVDQSLTGSVSPGELAALLKK